MRHRIRIRFFIETSLAVLAASSFLATLVWPAWIEAVFGFSPDNGNGSLELIIASMLGAATIALAATARVEWRRRSALAT